MANPNKDSLKRRMQGKGILLLGAMFTLWTSGCAHDSRHSGFARGGAQTLVPKLTSVTTWPLAMFLTNGNGYESEFTMTFGNAANSPLKLSGQLLVRGGKLRLEAAFDKSRRLGDFGVIWDDAAHQGYVFSEALQGYAPINETTRCTNLLTQVVAGNTERIEGHPVDKADATVTGSDGQRINVQLLRAQDLGNLPLKIDSIDRPHPFALVLSKILLIVPAEELFSPPDGFTKYASETAMLDELAARQQSPSAGRHERVVGSSDDNPSGINRRYNTTPP